MEENVIQRRTPYFRSAKRRIVARLAWAAALAVASVQASAAIQTFDPTLLKSGGGSGNWDTSTANWLTGAADVVWAGDTAQFGVAPGTVTVTAGGLSANQLLFAHTAANYTIIGGQITLTSPAVIGWIGQAPATSSTISSILAGSNGLTVQSGAGGTAGETLTLLGANSYTGGTTINGGTVVLSNTNVSNAYVVNGGAIKLDFNASANTLASDFIASGTPLTLGNGAAFNVVSKSTPSTNSQTLGGVVIAAGNSTFSIVNGNAGSSAVLKLGAITRNVGGTANFALPTVNTAISAINGYTTSTINDPPTNLLGPGLTVGLGGGTDWAVNNGTNIAAFSGYVNGNAVSGWSTNDNLSNTAAYSGTLGGNLTVSSLRFNVNAASSITLGSSTLTVSNGILLTSTVSASGSTISGGTLKGASGKDLVIIQNNSGVLAISSSIADNGSATALTKSGGGILTLSGSNGYSGATYVNAGTLNINNNNAVGTGTLTLLNGVTIDNTSGGTITLSGINTVSLGTPGLASTVTYTGTSGSVLNLGAGGVTIQYATAVANMASSGNSFTLAVNGGTLNFMGSVAPTGTGFYNSMLIKTGNGTLALSAANIFPTGSQTATNGRILLRGGTLAINNALALGTGGLTVGSLTALDNTTNAPITLSNNPALAFQAGMNFTGTQSLNYGTGSVALQVTPTITVSANTLTLGGAVSGGFGLNKAGPGTLALTAATSTYTGATSVTGGTLIASGSKTLGSGGANTTGLNGSTFVNAATAAATLDLTGATTVNEAITLSGGAGSNIASLVVGSGTTTLSNGIAEIDFTTNASAIYTNTTTAVSFSGGGGAGATASAALTGAKLLSTVTVTAAGSGYTSAPTVVFTNNNATTPQTATAIVSSLTLTGLNNNIGGAGNLVLATQVGESAAGAGFTKIGVGTLTFSGTGANAYTGLTSVNGGELDLNKTVVLAVAGNLTVGDGTNAAIVKLLAANQIATTSTVTIASAATFNLNGLTNSIANLAMTGGTLTGSGAGLTVAHQATIAGTGNTINSTLSDSAGALLSASATLTGTAGSVTGPVSLSGNNSLSGTMTFGSLSVGGTGNAISSGTITGNATFTSGAAMAVNGTLAGTVALGNGTLNGSGTVSGQTTVASTGTLAPGSGTGSIAAIGTLTVGGLAVSSASKLAVDVNITNNNPTDTADKLISTGAVSLGSGIMSLELVFSEGTVKPYGQSFVLVNNTSALSTTGFFADLDPGAGTIVTNGGGILDYSVNYAAVAGLDGIANDVSITFTSVPEPTSLALVGMTAGGLLSRRRRRWMRA